MLHLVCRGANNAEIAVALRIGERTVKSHVAAILAKLGSATGQRRSWPPTTRGCRSPAGEPCRARHRAGPGHLQRPATSLRVGSSLSRSGSPR